MSARAPSARSVAPSVFLAEELYRLIGRSRRELLKRAARALEAQGQSILTWQVVCYLDRHGPTSQRDLAAANAQHPAGISRLVEELQAEGLVKRKADPADRRRSLVEATARGRAWLAQASPSVMEAVDGALGGLTSADRKELRDLLERLLASLSG